MGYLIALFAAITFLFSAIGGHNPVNNLFASVKQKIFDTIAPKSEREIIVENMQQQYNTLEHFFAVDAPQILNSKTVPETRKTQIRTAQKAFTQAQTLLTNLKKKEKSNPGVLETILQKTLGIVPSPSPSSSPSESPTATYVPPQCKMVCDNN